MPTISPRALGVMLSGAALAGWLSGSALNPPVAATQVGTPRARPAPTVPTLLPRVAPPAPSRNPFTFRSALRPGSGEAPLRPVSTEPALPAVNDADAAVAPVAQTTAWRLAGIATSESGDVVAVLSGGGEVVLVRAGDDLPGGDGVVDVGAAHVVVQTATGAVTLRLP